MAQRNWTLDTLKNQLSQIKDVKGWIISQEHVHRRERYFMREQAAAGSTLAVDQDRDARIQNIYARILVHLDGKPGRQGEITQKLFPSLPLKEQLERAIDAAKQTDHQAWDLPKEIPAQVPQLATTDPKMAEDLERVMTELTQQVAAAVSKKRPSAFNSAELFLSVHDNEMHLSTGLNHRASQSRIYAEAAYSMSRKAADGTTVSDEYLHTLWSVSLQDISIDALFDETAERAEHSLDVLKPKTGKYSVMIDSEVLLTLLNGHIHQLTATNAYNRLPFVKVGEELIPQAQGDLLTLTLDPTLEFGAQTLAFSPQGVLQKPLKLVDRNRVVATAADQQNAQYLSLPVTTAVGNVVIEAGKHSHRELTQAASQVLEILQFSGLFADPNSGTFSSEIRLAKLYDNVSGKTTFIKGGSLSGSIVENFKGLKLSKNLVKRSHFSSDHPHGQGYYGPDYALLSDVSIVG